MSGVRRVVALVIVVAAMTGGCGGAPILANEPLVFPTPPVASVPPARPPDPIPVVLPRDDGPHDRLTEWWYYTGHLRADDGRTFGFQAVVFRAERGATPAAWASHVALTDEDGKRFLYAQRSEVGPQVDVSPRDAAGIPTGFDLRVAGQGLLAVPLASPGTAATPWRLAGAGGIDRIEAQLTPEEAVAAGAPFGFALDVRPLKAPALHDGDGFVDFGPAGSSYYYSRTRLEASGVLSLDGRELEVEGIAWFDHQWGDFVSVGGGGWDWFAINLEDGVDITVSVVLNENLAPTFRYGTLVAADGSVFDLDEDQIGVSVNSDWRSPATGRTYPGGFNLVVAGYEIDLRPTVADQELDTRATTGVIYWEGSQDVEATRDGVPVGGEAYVEITRYADSE